MQLFKRVFLSFLLFFIAGNVFALTLPQCGRIIANKNGYYDFRAKDLCKSKEMCPAQIDAILAFNNQHSEQEKQIHFTRMPVRALKDGTWVVAYNQYQYMDLQNKSEASNIKPIPNVIEFVHSKRVKVNLDEIDSVTLAHLQKYHLHVYRLADFASHDPKGEMCYLLTLRNEPNENIVNDIDALDINDRTLVEAQHNKDNHSTAWFNEHQGKKRIWFAGYVSSKSRLEDLLVHAKNYPHMWAIRVSAQYFHAKSLIKKINNETSYVTLANSMTCVHPVTGSYVGDAFAIGATTSGVALANVYAANIHEKLRTACDVPIKKFHSYLAVTNRPAGCIKHYSKRNDTNLCVSDPARSPELCQ